MEKIGKLPEFTTDEGAQVGAESAPEAEETTAAVKGLLSVGVKPADFAFFTQNDPSGDSIYNAAIRTLKEFGFKD